MTASVINNAGDHEKLYAGFVGTSKALGNAELRGGAHEVGGDIMAAVLRCYRKEG